MEYDSSICDVCVDGCMYGLSACPLVGLSSIVVRLVTKRNKIQQHEGGINKNRDLLKNMLVNLNDL